MRPSRLSSEGPEVVPEERRQTPDKYLVPFPIERPSFQRVDSPLFQQSKGESPDHGRDNQDSQELPEQRNFPPHPAFAPMFSPPARTATGYNPVPYGIRTSDGPQRRFGLITVLLVVVAAFLIGGGVGGGVGGALVASEKSKVTSLQNKLASAVAAPTATTSAPPSVKTIITDQALCPLVNNATYNSTSPPGYNFLKQCATDISGPSNIDISSSLQTSFDSCLDACASYNANVASGGCLGATWVMFSSTKPETNSFCFLKNATGSRAPAAAGEYVASGFLKRATPAS